MLEDIGAKYESIGNLFDKGEYRYACIYSTL
jgi:hypothetical protein